MLEHSTEIKEKSEEMTLIKSSEKLRVQKLFELSMARINLLSLKLNNYLVKLSLEDDASL